jgi:hypothetical protein
MEEYLGRKDVSCFVLADGLCVTLAVESDPRLYAVVLRSRSPSC